MDTNIYGDTLLGELNKSLPNVRIRWEHNGYGVGIAIFFTIDFCRITGAITYPDMLSVTAGQVAEEIKRQAQRTLVDIMTNNLQ